MLPANLAVTFGLSCNGYTAKTRRREDAKTRRNRAATASNRS